MAEPPLKKMALKRKCKFNEDWRRDFAWIAKLPDNGMVQCRWRRVRALDYGGWDGPVAYHVTQGQNEVDGVTRAETMFAYWIAHHNLPEYNIEHSAANLLSEKSVVNVTISAFAIFQQTCSALNMLHTWLKAF